MQYKKNSKIKKNPLKKSVVFAGLLIVASLIPSIYLLNDKVFNSESQTPSEVATPETQETPKIDLSPIKEEEKNPEPEDGKVDPSQTETPTINKDIQITLAAAGQDVKGGPIIVSGIVGGIKSGGCSLTISHDEKQITKTNVVTLQGTYYACEEFSVPAEELGVSGIWKITLDVVSGEKYGSVTQETEVVL